jgi:hypothetical protein
MAHAKAQNFDSFPANQLPPEGSPIIWAPSLDEESRVDRIDEPAHFPGSRVLRDGSACESKTQATQSNWKMNRVVNLNLTWPIRQLLPAALIAFYLSMSCAPKVFGAVEELLPPFGFRWNDSMARVDAVLHGAKAKIISREKKENREIWTVEGLVHPGLKRTLFTFKERSLVEVELQYEYPDRTIEWYNQRMGEIRKYFDEKYGTGKLVSRSRDTDTDVIQTLVGYQWMVGTTMLELFYFSAQHDALVYRTISVDYKEL